LQNRTQADVCSDVVSTVPYVTLPFCKFADLNRVVQALLPSVCNVTAHEDLRLRDNFPSEHGARRLFGRLLTARRQSAPTVTSNLFLVSRFRTQASTTRYGRGA
jgi:hypothetical protein